MRMLLRAYLWIGAATLFASAVIAAYTIIIAPFHNYEVLVLTNAFGEGKLELIAVLLSIPAWIIIAKDIISRITGPGEQSEAAAQEDAELILQAGESRSFSESSKHV